MRRVPAPSWTLIISRGRAAIDRDGLALDVTRAVGAEKHRELGNVLWLTDAAEAVLGKRFGAQLFRRRAERCRTLLGELDRALRLSRAGMNDVDIDVVAIAELREGFGKIGHRSVHGSADGKFRIRRAR